MCQFHKLFNIAMICTALLLLGARDVKTAQGGFQGPDMSINNGNGGFAGPSNGGGFVGPSTQAQITTIAQAKKAFDDAPCVLTGNIIQKLAHSDDKYTFRDKTGEIIVDIDHEKFVGRTVTPNNIVRLYGEVDRDRFKPTKIDVKHLEIVR